MQVLFIWRDLEPESLPGMSSMEGAETGVGTGQYQGPHNLLQEDDVGESEVRFEDGEGLTCRLHCTAPSDGCSMMIFIFS